MAKGKQILHGRFGNRSQAAEHCAGGATLLYVRITKLRDEMAHDATRGRQIDPLQRRGSRRVGMLTAVLCRLAQQWRNSRSRRRADLSQLLRRDNARRGVIVLQHLDQSRYHRVPVENQYHSPSRPRKRIKPAQMQADLT